MSFLTSDILALLLRGLGYTLLLTAVTTILSLIIGITVGALRISEQPTLRNLAAIYVDIFRNIPALVLIIFWAFAVPNIFAPATRQALFFDNLLADWGQLLTGLSLPYYALAATIALTLNTSAYLAELFRAGIGAIAQEVVDAARSLGASPRALFWRILLPQGLRVAFPAISTRLIHNMKNTALAAFVAVPELFQATQTAVTRTFRAVELLLLASIFYWLLSFAFAAFLQRIDRRLNTAV
ncbi:MAG: amino acid ABC transporter permease [Chloroflexi bacterium]|nr:amino acid ABC transporter permease [Chloroflexota bacterium]